VVFITSELAYAQSTQSTADKSEPTPDLQLDIPTLKTQTSAELALLIAKQIDEEQLFINEANASPNTFSVTGPQDKDETDRTAIIRKDLFTSFFVVNNADYRKTALDYLDIANKSQDIRQINSAKFFVALTPFAGKTVTNELVQNLTQVLEPYTENPDWFVAANAWHILSSANNYNRDLNTALQDAITALSLIPNELSPEVSEMRIKLTETLAFLYARLRNPKLATANTARLIELQKAYGQPVDGAMHLNNLVYVFSHWRDHETAEKLAQTLLKNESSTVAGLPGLVQMRIAQTKNEQYEFAGALKTSRDGLSIVKNPSIQEGLKITEIVALAGSGDVETAELYLKEFEDNIADKESISDAMFASILHAKALIAFDKGETRLGQKLMTQRMDQFIQSTLRTNSASASKLIANLENTKSRQIERQGALQREADLREAELKQQTVTNSLLLVLSVLMGMAAILSALFARYRSKSASYLRIARDQAKAGEKAKSEFLAIMSHELRTPLNGIIGIADLLATTAPTEDLRHKNEIILQSGNDLLSLVEGILDMSRIEAGELGVEFEPVQLRKLISDVDEFWRPLIEKRDIRFTTFVDESVPDIFTSDQKRMRQCINNLVSNAAKFTQSGRIHVHVTSTPAEKRGDMVLSLIVADTGSGIREEVIERLFKPFVQADASITRQYGGSGLGLAITRSLARMLGGDVGVVSREGRGSEFTLTFQGSYSQFKSTEKTPAILEPKSKKRISQIPVLETPVLQAPVVEAQPSLAKSSKAKIETTSLRPERDDIASPVNIAKPMSEPLEVDENTMPLTPIIPEARETETTGLFSGLRVLIVEDVVSNQDIIQIFLRPLGCKFISCNNGVEALRALEIYDFDIILMDIRMPEMDGIEATKRIRERKNRYCDLPIIALTADKTEETQTACRAAGVDLFLTKPIISKDLISAVRFVIEHPPERGVPYMSERKNST